MQKGRTIIVAPNGARRTKEDHTQLPMTLDDMNVCLRDVANAGAAMAHMHVRDVHGKHTLDVGLNREWLTEMRARFDSDLVIQLTTEAVGMYQPEEQIALVQGTEPETVSLALRELHPTPVMKKPRAVFSTNWLNVESMSNTFCMMQQICRFIFRWLMTRHCLITVITYYWYWGNTKKTCYRPRQIYSNSILNV